MVCYNCVGMTHFATGDRECSDFKKVDAYTTFTHDNKKVYIVKTSYTMKWSGDASTYSIVNTSSIIFDKNGSLGDTY